METSLRPMSLGEILDRTAQLYRENFVLFAGIFAVYAGITLVMNLLVIGAGMLMTALHVTRYRVLISSTFTGIDLLILFLLLGAAVAAISRAVAWVHLGEPATIRGAYASILPRLGRYLWLMTITAFVIWTPLVLLYSGYLGTILIFAKGIGTPPAPGQAPDPQTTIIVLGATITFFLLLVPVAAYTIFMGLRYALALPACVVENLKARPSLRRAIELSKGSRGRIFVLGLLVGIIKVGLVLLAQLFVIVAAIKHRGQMGPGLTALSQVIAFFTDSFLGPIYATGITLFYYDQRIRKEGFDIEWMMQAAGLTVPTPKMPAEPRAAVDTQIEAPPSASETQPSAAPDSEEKHE